MKTLESIGSGDLKIPMWITWYLSDIGRAQGLQELFTRQSPQKLRVLREHAIAQSAVSSNRIEGVEIDNARVGTVVFGSSELKDRDEEEVAGYRDALNTIHSQGADLPVSERTILDLHRVSRGEIWDAGKYKDKPVDIIEKLPAGGERVRFRSVAPADTPAFTTALVSLWQDLSRDRAVSPLITMAAFNLDFLCIHPFRDGNGRVSRLLLLLTAYHLGVEVGRYIILERIIEQNKERYYETLEQSSQSWHGGKHDPWPYIGYLLYVFKQAYDELERRVGELSSPRGENTALIIGAVEGLSGEFSVSDILDACPGVSIDLVRRTLKKLRADGRVECLGMGRNAKWRRK
ncbi:MAG: Fic family protein [Chloroflexi bacterium]|nr:Fic family protein [Chloroflexota bacterium]